MEKDDRVTTLSLKRSTSLELWDIKQKIDAESMDDVIRYLLNIKTKVELHPGQAGDVPSNDIINKEVE